MARSSTDATRFTATGPYASSSPSFSSNPQQPTNQIHLSPGPAPANETPQQKISRLRAAAAAAKASSLKETPFDRTVRIGRAWADRAHRATAYGLIGLTVVSAMVFGAGAADMIIHNRRRRNEFMAEQRAKSAKELGEAKLALDAGRATEDQVLLINRERAAMEAEEAKRSRPGVFKRTTGWLFGGLSTEEQKGGRLGSGTREVSKVGSGEELLGEKEDKGCGGEGGSK
ncbi:uncharacterized protein LTR77_005641 [Saxophila tyrrhenica]|uniref:Uncharacterized protein n=1 Tax=Saxophila tyrrhenica TaxID=1690608 RepID=A0AAV9P9H6_9PEZI|nr:hypothetical protein LTR77_005641 [Saxophila tyrrhenica]